MRITERLVVFLLRRLTRKERCIAFVKSFGGTYAGGIITLGRRWTDEEPINIFNDDYPDAIKAVAEQIQAFEKETQAEYTKQLRLRKIHQIKMSLMDAEQEIGLSFDALTEEDRDFVTTKLNSMALHYERRKSGE